MFRSSILGVESDVLDQKALLVFDDYACNFSYKTLNLLRKNSIIVVGFAGHTFHVLQPLEVGVFGLMKEEFKSPLIICLVNSSSTRKHIFTICELLTWQIMHHFAHNILSVAFDKADSGIIFKTMEIQKR